jgi:hypothetical protein
MTATRPIRTSDGTSWRRLRAACLGFYETPFPEKVYGSPFVDDRGLLALSDSAPEADANGTPSFWLRQEPSATAGRLCDRIGQATPLAKYVRR